MSCPVIARSISERCGCVCASSSVMRPSSISDWTNVSSLVICERVAVAQQVGARIADVDEAEPGAREQDRGERGAHALEVGGVRDVPGDRGVAFDGGLAQLGEQVVAGVVVVEGGQRGDDQRGGDLAGGVATHPVGQRQQPGPGVDGVLVVLPDEPAVAAGGVTQDQRHVRGPS